MIYAVDDLNKAITLYDVEWYNPYTKTKELDSFYLPGYLILPALKEWLKEYKLKIEGDDESILSFFLDTLEALDKLEDDPTFSKIAKDLFYKSPEYEKAVKECVDDYEFSNDYGPYSEEGNLYPDAFDKTTIE